MKHAKSISLALLLFLMFAAGTLIAAYVPIIGTTNHISVTNAVGGLTLDLVGPYAPTSFTQYGVLLGNVSNSIGVTAQGASGIPLIGQGAANPIFGTAIVAGGGTGATTFTQNGLLFGNAANAIGALAELSNGQLAIGRTGNSPLPATLTAGVGISITNASGSITIKALGNQCATRASAATPITIATTDCLFLGSAAAGADQIVNLPAATATSNEYCIKKQDANARNIGVTPSGTDTIDGVNAVKNLAIQYQVLCFSDYAAGAWAVN